MTANSLRWQPQGRKISSYNSSSGEPASLPRFLVICFRQRIVATDPNPTDVRNSSLRRSGRDASRWFGLRQCQDQTDNIMKLGIVLPYSGADMSLPIDRVLEAERLGFDSIWTSEAYGSDAVPPAAWVLARTTRIKVGTAIMQMPARTPAMTAMTAMTLEALSGGRFVLGIGPSGPQVVEGWHGVAYGKPLLRTREYIEIIRKILERNEPLTYAGEHYQIPFAGPGATGLGKPLKSIMRGNPKMKIYTASIAPASIRNSAEVADGMFPRFMNPQRFELFAPHLNAGFAKTAIKRAWRLTMSARLCRSRWVTTSMRPGYRSSRAWRSILAAWAPATRISTMTLQSAWGTRRRQFGSKRLSSSAARRRR